MAKVPINPAVLRWAVRESGSSVAALTNVTGKSATKVEAWLDGSEQPHGGDLTKIAKHLGRPPLFFVRRTSPQKPGKPQVRFRRRVADGDSATPAESAVLREAEGVQALAAWLIDTGGGWPPNSISHHDSAKAAEQLQEELGWRFAADQRNRTKNQTFTSLRARVEDRGVVVMVKDLGANGARAFSFQHEVCPVVVINSKVDTPAVKTFSLLHEIGHLIVGSNNLHNHLDDNDVERWCDSLAAFFLLPPNRLREYIATYRKLERVEDDDLETVRLVSRYFAASWYASAIQLRDIGLATQGLVDCVSKTYEPKDPGFVPGGQDRAERRLAEFGSLYPRLILEAGQSGAMGDLDVRRCLRLQSTPETVKLRELAG